jgi:hypothetical protein
MTDDPGPHSWGMPHTIECRASEEAALVAAWHAANPIPPGYRPGVDPPLLVVIVLHDETEED